MWELLHFSDTHLFADAKRRLYRVPTLSLLEAVLRHAREHHGHAAVGVITGDLAHDDDFAYRLVTEQFSRLGMPIFATPGNHDEPVAMAEAFRQGAVRWQRVVEVRGWRLVFLNSSMVTESSGYLEDRELAMLDKVLTTREVLPTLLCMHHPPMPIGTPWLDQIGLHNSDELHRVIAPHGMVKGILCGHVHQECDVMWEGVRCLCAPGTGLQLASGVTITGGGLTNEVFSDEAPGYRWVRLAADGGMESGVERVEVVGRPKPRV